VLKAKIAPFPTIENGELPITFKAVIFTEILFPATKLYGAAVRVVSGTEHVARDTIVPLLLRQDTFSWINIKPSDASMKTW